ncbi:hypothetical protein PHYBOEH_005323 [Phytophthora boehmeriae]|uniref:DEP domain-containing protein n=1 Tax=Phytophthora boehmeriae TaxID=109152 RepID=A0A8T1X8Y0_9STRA|nr:hypothetical protein PHYBOEH_005323 [Phytophthora boehmeriae]
MGSQLSKSPTTKVLTTSNHKELSPVHLCADMKARMAVGSRYRHPLKKFRKCFSGVEAVNWIVEHKQARDASEAIRKGQTLLDQHFITKVDGAAKFECDPKRFYRFASVPSPA